MKLYNMEEQNSKEAAEENDEEKGDGEKVNQANVEGLSRKEKRKAMKKVKRKHMRKEMAVKEKEEEEAKLNDHGEQMRLKAMEEEESQRRERELKEYEERERAWIQAMELKKKKEEEEQEEEEKRRKDLEESQRQQVDKENESNEDDGWEYVEEGPAEIIFQGNEIIVRKKKVRVKKDPKQLNGKEDADRPTSNPLPPQSEVFSDYQNASSAQQLLENVAQQVPNFGTEQDKAHCPFHLKTGACRFGQRCSRVHFYPDKSSTLLIKNMYNGPGLAWEQDEGLEYTDEEVERCYEEFYEDVHTEFLKFGEIVNFKVCKNGSFHLRGNVYVHFKSLESAVLAYHSIHGRYFAGKQVRCEFVNVTRWKVAICGEYMKSRFKVCSRGMACNFIHCFRNPSGDYEWADWDKPPPKYWVKRMAALFGYSDEYEKQREQEQLGQLKGSSKMIIGDSHRKRSRRSRSSDVNNLNSGAGRSRGKDSDVRESTDGQRRASFKDYRRSESRGLGSNPGQGWSDRDEDRDRDKDRDRRHAQKSKGSEYLTDNDDIKKRIDEADSDFDYSDRDGDGQRYRGHTKNSRHHSRRGSPDDGGSENKTYEADEDQLDRRRERETHHGPMWRSSRQQSRVGSPADHGNSKEKNHYTDSVGEWSDRDGDENRHHRHKRKRLGHHAKVSESPDDHRDARYTTYDTDSSDDRLDRDRGRNDRHTRKHSRYSNEVTEYSCDRGEPVRGLKGKSNVKGVCMHSHSSMKDHSRMAIGEANSHDEGLSRSLGGYKGRCKPHDGDNIKCKSKENIDEQDCWEPGHHEKDQSCGGKITAESSESGSPGRYDGRNNSSDLDSECYYDEIVRDRYWDSEDVSEKHHKSRSNFACDDRDEYHGQSNSHDKNSGELYNEGRPSGSDQLSRERHSRWMDKERAYSAEHPEYADNYKKHHAKLRSHGHKRNDGKDNS